MKRTRTISGVAFVLLFVLLAVNFAAAKQNFRENSPRIFDDRDPSSLRLPSAGAMTAMFAGFETMAADIAWIACAVHYGRIDAEDPRPEFVDENARLVSRLDPYFHDVYGWYSGFYSQSIGFRSLEEIETVNSLLDRGIEHFPRSFWLPFDAGMNYVGSLQYESADQKLRAYERAVDYLERAARQDEGPAYVPLTVAHFHEEVARLREEVDDSPDDPSADATVGRSGAEFLSEMYYLVDDPAVRRMLEVELRETDEGRRALERLGRTYNETLRRRRAESFDYLSVPLWSYVAPDE